MFSAWPECWSCPRWAWNSATWHVHCKLYAVEIPTNSMKFHETAVYCILQWLFEIEGLQAAITLSIWLHSFHHFQSLHGLASQISQVDIFSLDSDRAWCRWSCVLSQLQLKQLIDPVDLVGAESQPRWHHLCATGCSIPLSYRSWGLFFSLMLVHGIPRAKNHLDLGPIGVLRSHRTYRTLITWGLCHLCLRRNWLEADAFFLFFPQTCPSKFNYMLLYFSWLRQIHTLATHPFSKPLPAIRWPCQHVFTIFTSLWVPMFSSRYLKGHGTPGIKLVQRNASVAGFILKWGMLMMCIFFGCLDAMCCKALFFETRGPIWKRCSSSLFGVSCAEVKDCWGRALGSTSLASCYHHALKCCCGQGTVLQRFGVLWSSLAAPQPSK